jgi:hypothetical protein
MEGIFASLHHSNSLVNRLVYDQKWESGSQLTAPREWRLYGMHSYVMEYRSWAGAAVPLRIVGHHVAMSPIDRGCVKTLFNLIA